jgi:hypothetical protein
LAGYEKSYFRNGLRGFVSVALLVEGASFLILIGVVPFHAKRIGFAWGLVAVAGLSVLLNLALFRPSNDSWALRELSFTTSIQNTFSGEAFEIRSFRGYPSEHVALARRGYNAATVNRRRLTTYPPGLPMLYYVVYRATSPLDGALNRLSKLNFRSEEEFKKAVPLEYRGNFPAAAAFSILHILAFALAVVLAGLAGWEFSGGDKTKSLMVAAAMAAIPSFTLYNVSESMLFVPLPLLALYLHAKFAERVRLTPFVLGVLYGGALFFSLAFLPLILFHMCFLILDAENWKQRFSKLLFFALGGGAAAFSQYLIFGYNSVAMVFLAISNNREFYSICSRAYHLSLPCNLYEFVLMSGVAWGVWASMAIPNAKPSAVKNWFANSEESPARDKILPLFLLVFALLILSGSVRGEVGRNWMCLMPLLVLGAVLRDSFDKRWFALCYGISAAALFAESIFLEVVFNYWI